MRTPAEREAETRESRAQKGAQHQDTSVRGCCAKAGELVENVGARGLIADRAYDSNKIVKTAESLDMKVVIPPRKNRKIQRKYDKKVYKIRRLVENARGVATRYCKNLSSFLASVQIRCLAIWGNIL